jgi:hypothetical protein
MLTFVVFITSLVLIIALFVMKSLDVSYGRKIFLEDFFIKCDAWILKLILKIKLWWGHINFKNTKLIFSWIVVSIRKIIISIKRRFDHKQSYFFTMKDNDALKNNGSVSFFLKHVSEYKKSLRDSGIEGRIEK